MVAWVVWRRSIARGSGVGAERTLVKVVVRARMGRMEKRMLKDEERVDE